jgi:hypothetical protein
LMFQIFNGGVVPRLRPRRLGMRRLYAVSVAALLISVPARAHDYWADAETLRPTPGAALDVWVAGGHAFPDAELALSPRLLRKVSLVGPDRRRGAVSVEVAADKRHKGSVALPDAPGVYLLDMVIQNPRHKQPQYVGRALLLAAGDEAPPGRKKKAMNHGWRMMPGSARIAGTAARIGSPLNRKRKKDASANPPRAILTARTVRLWSTRFFISFPTLQMSVFQNRRGFENTLNLAC